MSQTEAESIVTFEKLKQGELNQGEAAKLLGLSLRQVKRKLKAYRKDGVRALVHGARGKPGNRQLPQSLKAEAVQLVRERYADFGPSFASEKLASLHGIRINRETLRLLMAADGIWQPRRQKSGETHEWRPRRECRGELVQLDGSHHAWFEGRAPKCCLLAFIDDATSELLWAEFCDGESTENLLLATWHYLEQYGRPLSLYTDRGGVYKVNLGNEEDDRVTQYGRSLQDLHIGLIHARSPQAKGRVERLFGTLQDRLVKELRLAGISDIAQANRFLRETYLPQHNAKFAVPAKSPTDLHRSLGSFDLAHSLSLREERTLTPDRCLRYKNRWLQLQPKQPRILSRKEQIEVREHLDGNLHLWLRGAELSFQELTARPTARPLPAPVRPASRAVKPTAKAGSRAFLFA